ncbi:hypothetical protein ARMSODRAFT_1022337 [Armillaria solidipes]|uniref:Uncharacterized protein n=1 Tax=Armillaria solidipes TaxID=1076256 RepID=A0A2H3BNU6_9AGAR|nr:hypothetical protein ARMSODRAFT_1022337 [Armillaria solidipes]
MGESRSVAAGDLEQVVVRNRLPCHIDKLPTETLTEIFLATLDDDYAVEVGDAATLAMVIIQVCQCWRDIGVNDCPELWRRVSIGMPLDLRKFVHKDWKNLVHKVLERSRNRTLHIEFSCGQEGNLRSIGLDVFNMLVAESHRWSCVELYCYPVHLASLQGVLDRIPLLVSIKISVLHESFGVIPDVVGTFLGTAPLLKRVYFDGFLGSPIPNLHYHQLTEFVDVRFYVTDDIYRQYLAILKQAKHIQKFLTRYAECREPELAVAEPPILCPSIRVFTASHRSLIRSVILPNLEQVSVPGWVPDWFEEPVIADAQVVPSLLSTIKRSQCQTTLTVISMKDTILTEDVIGIARLAPALDKWVFSWQRWSDSYHDPLEQLIKGMAEKTITGIGGTAFTLLPVLTSLRITVDCLRGDLTPRLYFVGEPLANAMEARLGTHFGVVVRWADREEFQ